MFEAVTSTVSDLLLRDALTVIAGCGLTVHLIFKRSEPTNLTILCVLILVIPSVLSCILIPYYSLIPAVSLSFLTYFTSLLTAITLYRLSPFHPLARYPGPLLCKLSMFYMTWVCVGGKRHLYIQALHDRYGDIVRIGPNEVSIRDVSTINPLMGTNGLPKGPNWMARLLHPDLPSFIMLRDPVIHARRRRPWNRAFSTAGLKGFEPIITKRVSQLVEHLSSQTGATDITRWVNYFTYDFMGDMAFGGGTELMRDGDKLGLWRRMEQGMRVGLMVENLPWLAHLVKRLPGTAEKLKKMRAAGLKRAADRLKTGSSTKDLFYYLNNDDGAEKTNPSSDIVASDGNLAVIAGSDTTSSILCNIFYFLMRNEEVYKRLQQEVDKFYPPGEDSLDPKYYPEMPYLEAVINESLRLYPAVLSGSQRAPIPGSGGKAVGPFFVPEGTNARIHFYSVHRDPRNFFPLPNAFWPDRWLIAEGEQVSSEKLIHNLSAFIPFSFGPSNCVGKNLAMQEMRMVICHSIHNLEFRFADVYDPDEWERDIEDSFVIKKGQLPTVITVRK